MEDRENINLHNRLNMSYKTGKKMYLDGISKTSNTYDFASKYNLGFDAIDEAVKTYEEGHQDYISFLNDAYEQIANLPIDECTQKTEKLADAMTILEKRLDVATKTTTKRNILNDQMQNNRDDYAAKKEAKSTTASALRKADSKMDSSKDSLLQGLSSDVKKKITTAVKNGETIDITEFEDQLTEKQLKAILDRNAKLTAAYDAAQTADEAYYDTIANSREIAEQLANLPTDKMNDKLEDIDDAKELLNAKYSIADSSEDKNAIVDQQTKQAKKELAAYTARVTQTQDYAESLWDSKDLKSARKSEANKGIEEGEKLSLKGLKVGSAEYDAVVKYNKALEAQADAEREAEIAAANTTATIRENAKTKFDNVADDYDTKNKVTEAKISKLSTKLNYRDSMGYSQTSSYQKDVYNSAISENQTLLDSQKDELSALKKSLKQNGKNMSAEDFAAAQAEITNLEESILSTKATIADLQSELDNIEVKKLEISMERLQAKADKLQDNINLNETKGISATSSDYKNLISNSKQQVTNLEEQNALLMEQKKKYSTNSEKYQELQAQIESNESAIRDAKQSQEEWNNSIVALPIDKLERELEILDSIATLNKSNADLKSKQGLDLSYDDYNQQILDNNDQISNWTSKASEYYHNMLLAEGNADKVYGGKTADQWKVEMNQANTEVNNLKISNEELKDALRDDVYWRDFERAHEATQRTKDEIEGIAGLISDDMVYDSDGKLTDFGISKVATLVKEYELASDEVQNYTNDIENLHELYANGEYTESEYTEKLAELKQGLLDSASSMKSYTDSIVDMYKEMGQAELDSLFEVIDARNDALAAKKKYAEYDKNLKNKNQTVQSLKAEIAALEGVQDAASKAELAKKRAELAEAEEDLEDTISDHKLELSQDALTGMKDALQDAFDDRWDNIHSDLGEIAELMSAANELTSSSAQAINQNLSELLKYYGVDPSEFGIDMTGIKNFAKGTPHVGYSGYARTQEDGGEIVLKDGTILIPVKPNDAILANDMTENLLAMARGEAYIPSVAPEVVKPTINVVPERNTGGDINVHYDSVIHVDGNVDKNIVTDIKQVGKQLLKDRNFMQGTYDFNVKEIARDARKVGIKV